MVSIFKNCFFFAICGSSQDAFRDAILQRGPIESFALKTVQEFIQPQVSVGINYINKVFIVTVYLLCYNVRRKLFLWL